MREHGLAVGTGTNVVARVAHPRGIAVIDNPGAIRVRDEDPVVGERRVDVVRVSGRSSDVVAPPGPHPDLARAIAAVPPDLISLAAIGPGEVVADGHVLDVDTRDLEHLHAVPAVVRLLLV